MTLVEEVSEARLETSSEVQPLLEAIRELTEVVRNSFKELKEVNCLQRLVNEEIEKIKKRNWKNYEKTVRRREKSMMSDL